MNTFEALRPEGRQDLAVLTELSAAMTEAGLDLPVVLDTITDLLATHLGDVGMIYLLDDDGVTLEMASLSSTEDLMYEFVTKVLGDRPRRTDDPGPIAECLESRRPVHVGGIPAETLRAQLPDEYKQIVDHFPPEGRYHLFYVPMTADGDIVGILFASRYTSGVGFDEHELDLLCDVAELASPMVANAKLHARMAEMTAVFETAFERAPVAMAIHTTTPGPGTFVKVNESLAGLLGLDQKSVVGAPITDFLPVEDRSEIIDLVRAVAAGELTEYRAHRSLTRPDGIGVDVEVHSRAVEGPDGTQLILTQIREPGGSRPVATHHDGPRP